MALVCHGICLDHISTPTTNSGWRSAIHAFHDGGGIYDGPGLGHRPLPVEFSPVLRLPVWLALHVDVNVHDIVHVDVPDHVLPRSSLRHLRLLLALFVFLWPRSPRSPLCLPLACHGCTLVCWKCPSKSIIDRGNATCLTYNSCQCTKSKE